MKLKEKERERERGRAKGMKEEEVLGIYGRNGKDKWGPIRHETLEEWGKPDQEKDNFYCKIARDLFHEEICMLILWLLLNFF